MPWKWPSRLRCSRNLRWTQVGDRFIVVADPAMRTPCHFRLAGHSIRADAGNAARFLLAERA
jgi:hypothetical protein